MQDHFFFYSGVHFSTVHGRLQWVVYSTLWHTVVLHYQEETGALSGRVQIYFCSSAHISKGKVVPIFTAFLKCVELLNSCFRTPKIPVLSFSVNIWTWCHIFGQWSMSIRTIKKLTKGTHKKATSPIINSLLNPVHTVLKNLVLENHSILKEHSGICFNIDIDDSYLMVTQDVLLCC